MSKRLSLSLLILVAFTVFCGLPAVFASPIIPASQSAITTLDGYEVYSLEDLKRHWNEKHG